MSKPSSLKYPADSFTAECHRFDPSELVEGPDGEMVPRKQGGWNDPSHQLLFKAVFPGFEDKGEDVDFKMMTALVLQNTGLSPNVLSTVHPAPVIKGFGVSDRAPEKQTGNLLQQSFDAAFDRLLGGGGYMALKEMLDRWRGVVDKTRHRINLTVRDDLISSDGLLETFYLSDPKYLKGRKFPIELFPDMPEMTTGVLFSSFTVRFTADKVAFIVDKARHVNRRYDKTPRLVLRFDYPESAFYDIGTHPKATFHTAFQREKNGEWETSAQEVPLEHVVYTRVEQDGL